MRTLPIALFLGLIAGTAAAQIVAEEHLGLHALAEGAIARGALGAGVVTEDELARDAAVTDSVLTNGMGRHLHRYSPLAQIDRSNVDALEPAWSFPLGTGTHATQPLVLDGIIYVTSPPGSLTALSEKDGNEIWRHEAEVAGDGVACCNANLGAALYGERIFFATADGQLVALDRRDGTPAWSATLHEGTLGTYTAPPLVVAGLVITGGIDGSGRTGTIRAHDTETGELVWSRPVIEGFPGTFEGRPYTISGTPNASWPGDSWRTGGGAVWLGGTYDEQTNTVVFGTGHPQPADPYRRSAAGPAPDAASGEAGTPGKSDNLYAAARLALNPENGEIKWYFQTTPRDAWGFDGVSELVPFVGVDGLRYWATADNNGFFYVLRRNDGGFVRARPFIDGITWAKRIDQDGRPVISTDDMPGDPPPVPGGAAADPFMVVPAPLSGRTWMPMAHSPRTGLFYVPANAWGAVGHTRGGETSVPIELRPVSDEYLGMVSAIDPISGETKWRFKSDVPFWSGAMATGGGLVFVGTAEGAFIALNDETGEVLWRFQAEAGIAGQPITWERDGVQFVAVTTGLGNTETLWGERMARRVSSPGSTGSLLVFSLPAPDDADDDEG